jgi:hypothetical protein
MILEVGEDFSPAQRIVFADPTRKHNRFQGPPKSQQNPPIAFVTLRVNTFSASRVRSSLSAAFRTAFISFAIPVSPTIPDSWFNIVSTVENIQG